ncbi:MAG: hypothetical protein ACFFBD_09505, partial [Candidatus Hodarchaeota archaeon]
EGSSKLAAEIADCPIINCGDATHNPIQALVDLYSIRATKGKITGLEIGIIGDLKNSQDIKSFIQVLSNFDAKIHLISREELRLSGHFLHDFRTQAEHRSDFGIYELRYLKDCISKLDVLDLSNLELVTEGNKPKYVIDETALKSAKHSLMILPPMPQKAELPVDLETSLSPSSATPLGTFFTQAKIAVPLAMALLEHVLKFQK